MCELDEKISSVCLACPIVSYWKLPMSTVDQIVGRSKGGRERECTWEHRELQRIQANLGKRLPQCSNETSFVVSQNCTHSLYEENRKENKEKNKWKLEDASKYPHPPLLPIFPHFHSRSFVPCKQAVSLY